MYNSISVLLDGVHGVDLNPFAVAIARFRLLVAALRACNIRQLGDAPAFKIHFAVGDSLLHGRRFRELDLSGDGGHPAGYVGMITTNSFMKREFGKKLIEEYLPTVDLTHVIDTSGANIPGHGTPTVILFGRDRRPAVAPARRGRRRAG